MSAFSIIFAAGVMISLAVSMAIKHTARKITRPALKRVGETTLGSDSIHWLAAIALLAALLLCSLAA